MNLRYTAKILYLLIALFFTTGTLYAQTGSIRGFVYDKETGEPALFVNVYLKGTTTGAATDVNGYFSITKIQPGDYTLEVNYVGFDTLLVPVSVKADEIITKKLYLTKSTINLQQVDISAERQEAKTEVKMSVTTITPKEMKQIPTIGGEPDLAQYLQVLPGVIFTGDQGGQLYIRGGTPVQNLVLLDGMVIYNPFHSIGLFSVFDADIIRSADVYTGGFNAEYGDRISSVMDITTRDGNQKRYGGKLSVNPFVSKLNFEGPIKKAKEEGDGASSFLFSIKDSYLDKTSKSLYSYVDEDGLPYSFLDLYGKISLTNPSGSKLNLFGFNFNDDVTFTDSTKIGWNSTGFGTHFVAVPGGSPVLIGGTIAFSQYKIALEESDVKPRNSLVNGFNLGLNFTYFQGKNELKYGFELLGYKTDFEFYNSANRKISQAQYTTELGVFLKYKFVAGRFVIDPGLRLQYYASLSEFSPEPRLGIKYNATEKMRFKFAGGLYSQNLLSASSDRDVVNLFYGFLSGPDDLQKEFDGKEVTSHLQKARHAIFGVEYDLPYHFSLNVETYVKDFNQLINLNPYKVYEDNAENSSKPDREKKDFIIEKGLAKGVDFLLKYDYKKLYLWFVYSLGYVTRDDGYVKYEPHFDRRHNLNLVASYTFGKKASWQADVRWNFGSGFPFTQTAGFYEYLNFNDGISTDYVHDNGDLGTLYGDIYKGRLPYYHRLDVSVKKTIVINTHSNLEITGSITNVYDRKNIFYVNRVTSEIQYQLPVLPSLGVSITF